MLVRDRVKELRRVRAGDLLPDPRNWREHPQAQREALRGVLAEVGYADAVLARETPAGLMLVDGHLRADLDPDQVIPVLVLDVDEAEAVKILVTLDPLAAMAEANKDTLESLLREVDTGTEAIQQMLADLAAETGVVPSEREGYRAGEGSVAQRVTEWRDATGFLTCPDDVRAILDAKTVHVVEFSGGKDSLATLLWVRRMYPDRKTLAAYVDTGVEFPGLGAYVWDVATLLGAEPVIIKPEKEWWSWMAQQGQWPSLIHRPCMAEFIHKPWSRWVRAHYKPEEASVHTGSRAEEAMRGSKKTATSPLDSLGTNGGGYYHYAPCFNVTKPVIEQVLSESGVPLWEGYARGFVRTACWCCPGMRGAQAAALEDNYPGLAEDIRRWEKRLGVMRPLSNNGAGVCFDQILAAGRKQEERAKRLDSEPQPRPKRGRSSRNKDRRPENA